jgi:putative Mn2+ efflux pump MntP
MKIIYFIAGVLFVITGLMFVSELFKMNKKQNVDALSTLWNLTN